MKPPNMSEVIADNLIRMLIEGPEVSLRGSPTVSPTTAALNSSVGFPSLSFFIKMKGLASSASLRGCWLV